jgi:transposase
VLRRFSRWSIKGVWWRIFEAMSDNPDFEYLIVDSTIVRIGLRHAEFIGPCLPN